MVRSALCGEKGYGSPNDDDDTCFLEGVDSCLLVEIVAASVDATLVDNTKSLSYSWSESALPPPPLTFTLLSPKLILSLDEEGPDPYVERVLLNEACPAHT